ncbi:MAG: ABC transporter permease [Candidatus Binatia bacterium]
MTPPPAPARPARHGFSWRTIRAILRREFIDVLRDRRSLILTFLYPISMLIMYGYGIRYDVDNVPLTILDYDQTPESRDLAEAIIRSGYFQLVRQARTPRDIDHDLTTETSKAAVIIPVDFATRLHAGEPAAVQALIDGSDSNTATIAEGYLLAMIARYSAGGAATARAAADQATGAPATTRAAPMPGSGATQAGAAVPIELKSRIWYNAELKSVNFIVPGIIAVIMMIVGAILTALSIVKEKERGTIEQILVSPIHPLEMMVGKIIPYVLIAFIDLVIVVTAGYLVFHVPIKGSLVQLGIFSLLYLIASLGTGVFVSTIAESMQTAMLAAIFLSLLPSVLLSGFVFPIENMPVAIRVLTYFFPGRYFVTAIRGIYLKGVGLSVLWPEAVLLLCFSAGIVWLSASRFQEKLG